MTRPPRRRPQLPLTTLLVSVALAVTVGAMVYLATTSLPFLASSPTSDPTFGALNECLLSNAPQRVGFCVSRDVTRAAAWNPAFLVECRADGDGVTSRRWDLSGVTVGAYGPHGSLWVAARSADAGSVGLFVLHDGEPQAMGEVAAQALVGTAQGVVALEPTGHVLALTVDGSVTGARDLPSAQGATMSASADGQRVAISVGGGLIALEAKTLELLRAEAPCDVREVWWTLGGHRVLLSCGPDEGWALELDVDSGRAETAPGRERVPSVLAGPQGPWVRPCDVLPCTAEPP